MNTKARREKFMKIFKHPRSVMCNLLGFKRKANAVVCYLSAAAATYILSVNRTLVSRTLESIKWFRSKRSRNSRRMSICLLCYTCGLTDLVETEAISYHLRNAQRLSKHCLSRVEVRRGNGHFRQTSNSNSIIPAETKIGKLLLRHWRHVTCQVPPRSAEGSRLPKG
jgi:hypothetical protein